MTSQISRSQCGRALPLQRGNGQVGVHFDGQHKTGERCAGAGRGSGAAVFNVHQARGQLVDLRNTVQQTAQRPVHLQVVHLHTQRALLPAQPLHRTPALHRALHIAGLQSLSGGQPLRQHGQRGGKRTVGAAPEPQRAHKRGHSYQSGDDNPCRNAQSPHQKLNPTFMCRRKRCTSTP